MQFYFLQLDDATGDTDEDAALPIGYEYGQLEDDQEPPEGARTWRTERPMLNQVRRADRENERRIEAATRLGSGEDDRAVPQRDNRRRR